MLKVKSHLDIISTLIVLGFLFRLYHSLTNISHYHPDEHFQVLEPAYWSVHGFGFKTWEWREGLRSWITPSLFIPVISIAKTLGINGGGFLISLCKIWMSILWLFSAYGFKRLLSVNFSFSKKSIILGMSLYTFSAVMIVWSTNTLSEVLGTLAFWGPLFYIFNVFQNHHTSRSKLFLSGFLILLPYLFRIQMLALALPMSLFIIIFYRPKIESIAMTTLGALSVILLQGFIDLLTWGGFLSSTITNIKMNLFQNVASRYGVSPFYAYPQFLWNSIDLGSQALFVAMIFLGIFLIIKKPIKKNPSFTLVLILFISAFSFFLAHSMIPHKETRFLIPLVPFFICLFSSTWNYFEAELPALAKTAFIGTLLFCLSGPIWMLSGTWKRPEYGLDISQLSSATYEFNHRLEIKNPYLCLFREFWTGTRGYMGMGANGRIKRFKYDEINKIPYFKCDYIIVHESNAEPVLNKLRERFKMTQKDHKGHLLLRSVSLHD